VQVYEEDHNLHIHDEAEVIGVYVLDPTPPHAQDEYVAEAS
jgi:hypothetical protein